MFVRAKLAAPALLVAGVLIAGCGSSSKSSSSTAASSASSSSTAAATSTPAATGGTPVSLTAKKDKKLGTILAAGPKKLTVYMFEGDKGGKPACSGMCVSVWPPVTGKAAASGGAMSADLGTVTRSDGTMQVTYKGHPLYYFAKDGDAGDAYGQGVHGFGSDWYTLAPSGKKVDKS